MVKFISGDTIISFFLSANVYAENDITHIIENFDNFEIDELEQIENEQVDSFGAIWDESIKDPQFVHKNFEESNIMEGDVELLQHTTTYQLTNPEDDYDINLIGLTSEQCENQSDGEGFKNIINTPTGINRDKLLSVLAQGGFSVSTGKKLCASIQGSCSDRLYIYYSFVVYERSSNGAKNQLGNCIVSCKFENGELVTKKIVHSKQNDILENLMFW